MRNDLVSKLRRMRGDSTPARSPHERGTAATSLDRATNDAAEERIRRALQPKEALARRARKFAVPSVPMTPASSESLELDQRENERGTYSERVQVFPFAHRHGNWRLDEVVAADADVFELLTGDASLRNLDLSRAVFLDTETTGLSGGTGTYVFQIGLGWFEEGGFVST